ncbi:hypothetical protein ACEWY4_012893 [Coilia grayii]|uniref:P2X purinoreceptor 7 intracellular domain-containing protein n=1 Tax=Coilia grayii TaxID=363190 RepID=A0ABD1JUX1_9TELE
MSSEIQPYVFDPESEEEGEMAQAQSLPGRLSMNVSEWCTCGNCARMPTEAENVCCKETPPVVRRMGDTGTPVSCMTLHSGLEPVCLNLYSLQNALNIHRADYGPLRQRTYQRRCRHLAYRSFVSWCWGYLGRKVRVIIPACVVLRSSQTQRVNMLVFGLPLAKP